MQNEALTKRKHSQGVNLGRETCQPSTSKINIMNDIDRDVMMQSQVIEGSHQLVPQLTEKQKKKQVEAEKIAANPFYEMRINENDDDTNIRCDVCLEYEYEDDDLIVVCEMCNAAVHQGCYGSELMDGVPKGEWFCERCTHLSVNKLTNCRDVQCFLCDEVKGIIKNVDKA